MAEHIRAINPVCAVSGIEEFVTILLPQSGTYNCLFSDETIIRLENTGPACDLDEAPWVAADAQGLNCASYGSLVALTATFCLVTAARVLDRLIRD